MRTAAEWLKDAWSRARDQYTVDADIGPKETVSELRDSDLAELFREIQADAIEGAAAVLDECARKNDDADTRCMTFWAAGLARGIAEDIRKLEPTEAG